MEDVQYCIEQEYWTGVLNRSIEHGDLWIPEIGVTAELFWFHDKGYFEEFLDGKSGEIWTCYRV